MKYQSLVSTNSDCSLLIQFLDEPSLALSQYIHQLANQIEESHLANFVELVPAYNCLLLIFEPLRWNHQATITQLKTLLLSERLNSDATKPSKLLKIPVCYGKRFAPDLESLCAKKNISKQQFIERHSQPIYRVEMLGFLPGFLYLSGLDPRLHCARKSQPRISVAKGSIGIGGQQTGIYSMKSPGGWQIIGRTPIELFLPQQNPPAIADPFDEIQFYSISEEEFANYVN